MKIPKNVPNCSPGLESLSMLDQLFIKKGVCLTLKAWTSFGQTYKFVVKNNRSEGVGERSYIDLILDGFDSNRISFHFQLNVGVLGHRRYELLSAILSRFNSAIFNTHLERSPE